MKFVNTFRHPKTAGPVADSTKSSAQDADGASGNQMIKRVSSEEAAAPEREQRIRQSAYYRAERRGFDGDPVEDGLAAEAEIDEGIKDFKEATGSGVRA
jgi:hypothetical protein